MAAPGTLLAHGVRHLAWVLALCVALDLLLLVFCPVLWDDCLYGLFTLIAYPVMLAGPAGMTVPRLALRMASGWAGRAAISAAGAVALLALVAAGHVASVRLLNAEIYGPVLVKPRLLAVGLALAAVYYTALIAIAYARAGGDSE